MTQNFAAASNGGLFFEDYFEFEGAVDYIMEHPAEARIMALQGKKYVKENFAWDVMIEKYKKYFIRIRICCCLNDIMCWWQRQSYRIRT